MYKVRDIYCLEGDTILKRKSEIKEVLKTRGIQVDPRQIKQELRKCFVCWKFTQEQPFSDQLYQQLLKMAPFTFLTFRLHPQEAMIQQVEMIFECKPGMVLKNPLTNHPFEIKSKEEIDQYLPTYQHMLERREKLQTEVEKG